MDFKIPDRLRLVHRPAHRPAAQPALITAGLAEVRAYWEGLRRDGDIPARTDLDPRGMSGTLDRLFVAERIGTGIARVRIAGSALAEIAGVDLRGLPLTCLFQPEARPKIASLVERVFIAPLAAELLLEAERGIGRPALTAKLLLLPLRDADGSSTLILGCLAFNGGLGRAPRRFAIQRMTEERILEAQVPAQIVAEVAKPMLDNRRAHLRLVHSAK